MSEVQLHDSLMRKPDSSLRIALVGPSIRTLLGGQEVQLDLLARGWAKDPSFKVSLVVNNPVLPAALAAAERIPGLRTLLRFPLYMKSLWSAVKQADIVHAFAASHSSFLLSPMPACLLARRLGKKTIVHYHSGRAEEHLQSSVLARWLLRRVDLIVVPSGYLADVFERFGLRASIVPNVVDLEQFSYRPRVNLRPVLLCTRNFEKCCGVDDVVRAFRCVKSAMPAARLCLVGKGTEERSIRRLVSQLHIEDVEFAGAIPRDRIHEFYAKADILINASRIDNAPVSIFEAFASGLAVASSATGGIPYMVTHEVTGLLSSVGDIEGVANNVLRLVKEPDLAARLTHNARETAEQCSWAVVRKRWQEVYDALVTSQEE